MPFGTGQDDTWNVFCRLHTVPLNWITILLYCSFVQLKCCRLVLGDLTMHFAHAMHRSPKSKNSFSHSSIRRVCSAGCSGSTNKTKTYGSDGRYCASGTATAYTNDSTNPAMHLTASKPRQRDPHAIYVSFVPSFLLDNERDMVFHFASVVFVSEFYGILLASTPFRSTTCLPHPLVRVCV